MSKREGSRIVSKQKGRKAIEATIKALNDAADSWDKLPQLLKPYNHFTRSQVVFSYTSPTFTSTAMRTEAARLQTELEKAIDVIEDIQSSIKPSNKVSKVGSITSG